MKEISDIWRFALRAAILWLFIAATLVVLVWPSIPETAAGWLAFIAFGPPLFVLGTVFDKWFWSTRVGRAIVGHPSAVMRIFLYLVVGFLPIIFLSIVVVRLLFGPQQ